MVPIGPGRRAAFNAELAPAETDDHSNPQRGLAGLLTHQPSAMFSRSPPRVRHIYVRTGLRDHGRITPEVTVGGVIEALALLGST
jgi:hypothetical protein